MQKTLLILSGGLEGAKLAQRAKTMGVATVVADSDPQAPAFGLADSCLIADARSVEETTAAAERYHRKLRRIDGVLAAIPQAQATAAGVASRLQISGAAVNTKTTNRLTVQRALSEAGIATPWRIEAETPQALRRVAIEHGHNLILRPIESHVSGGAQHVTSLEDMDRAFMLVRQYSPGNRAVAEQYLDGPQILVQAAVIGNAWSIIAVADKVGAESSDEDRGFDLPSAISDPVRGDIGALLQRACAALGYRDGLVHSLIVLHKDQPYMLTNDAGLSGEPFWPEAVALESGVDLAVLAIKFALGETPAAEDLTQNSNTTVAQRYILVKRGRVARIAGEAAARAVSSVADMRVALTEGERILAGAEPRIAVAVLATGTSRDEAVDAAHDALSKIHIEMA